MKIASVKEAATLDKMAAEKYGLKPIILMENAGNAVHYIIEKEMGVEGNRFLILAGPGNNGGDGFVVGRKLYSNDSEVKIYILGDPQRYKDEARENLEIISKMQLKKKRLMTIDREFLEDLEWCDAIIDAIFGTGLRREVKGIYREVIEAVNNAGRTIFSIDIPSGINGDTGKVMGTAIKADYTITFGLPKVGLFLFPGADHIGKLYLSRISYPQELYRSPSLKMELNSPIELPNRERDTHKGDYGKTLFISGSSRYLGAPYLSAMSFLKAGGGLSFLATPKNIAPYIAVKGSEIIMIPLIETSEGSISRENYKYLLEFSDKVDLVVIGPGISLNEETQELVRMLVEKIERPIIIDGDGLTAVSRDLETVKRRRETTILTPHLGEMSRITGLTIETIKERKIDVVRHYSKDLSSIIVLKGANTIIGYPDGRIYINTSGNPGMATAGSGDVLTGSIAAMYGLGLEIEKAVRMGTFLHGLAGDLAANDIGMDGITASTILDYLPAATSYIREKIYELQRTIYYTVYTI
jgi:NAD(P)H-hydrate epimerase